ncbi:MAG: glycosyltransferase [Verrucomicrobia bacterium]|nr:glycosyltransferase [Verrucomicrobiota bacterium]
MPADAPVPRVTVAIPTYNRAAILRQTLATLARQDFPPAEWELLVIDNASTDDTPAAVAEFAGSVPPPRYLREPAQGLNHARNRAIAEARGEVLIFGDDDILVRPDWVRQMSAPLLADLTARRLGALGGEVIPVFPEGMPEYVRTWHRPLRFRADLGPVGDRSSPMGANLAFRRAVFAEHGLFRTDLDRKGGSLLSGGDSEMIARLRRAGLEIWFAPAAEVQHQMPATRTAFRYVARHAFDNGRSAVLERGQHSPAFLASRFLANLLKLIAQALLALLSALTFQRNACLRAAVRAIRAAGYLYQIARLVVGSDAAAR